MNPRAKASLIACTRQCACRPGLITSRRAPIGSTSQREQYATRRPTRSHPAPTPAHVDQVLRDTDGTSSKARLGANAIVGISMAVTRAYAHSNNLELWQTLTPAGVTPRLPMPHFNVVNGGAHAPNALDFQEFMLASTRCPYQSVKQSEPTPKSTAH